MNTLETSLNELVSQGYLLHGSTADIADEHLRPAGDRLYATNLASIAILKAVLSNKIAELRYPYFITETEPLEVRIKRDDEDPSCDSGFVYVVDSEGFTNEPPGSWQYHTSSPKRIIGRIRVRREDFEYPVIREE